MPRILFIAHHRRDRSPSQRFRYEQYTKYLKQSSWVVTESFLIDAWDDARLYKPGNLPAKAWILFKAITRRLRDILRAFKYDIVFVQREAFLTGSTFFERAIKKSGTKLVFDFDDSIWLDNVSEANKALSFLKNASKTASIIKVCDRVFAGNPYLAEYARKYNANTVVVPTTIDTQEYTPIPRTQPFDNITIGWSGSVTTIQHFSFAIPFLLKLKERYGNKVKITVIGDGAYRHDELQIQGLPWRKQDEIAELSKFDIGIMPLPNDEWARGKCGLKGLQYMALGVATIMSPVGVNTEIIQDGENGFLAATPEEWLDKLSRLIEDPDLRMRLGQAGRKTVVEKYSVQAWQDKYLGYFNQLVEKSG